MESLISLEEKLSKTDYLTRGVILKVYIYLKSIISPMLD